jgi:hypothetical protein
MTEKKVCGKLFRCEIHHGHFSWNCDESEFHLGLCGKKDSANVGHWGKPIDKTRC